MHPQSAVPTIVASTVTAYTIAAAAAVAVAVASVAAVAAALAAVTALAAVATTLATLAALATALTASALRRWRPQLPGPSRPRQLHATAGVEYSSYVLRHHQQLAELLADHKHCLDTARWRHLLG